MISYIFGSLCWHDQLHCVGMISYMQQFKSDANLSSTTKICFLCETGVGCCNVFPTGTKEYNSDVKIDFGGRVGWGA